ncbi:hypothetical protein OSTOST_02377, partial [Ostertagia ostertagi]
MIDQGITAEDRSRSGRGTNPLERAYIGRVRGTKEIRTVKAILESETLSVDDALGRYSSAADSLAADTPSLDILKKVNSNVETAVAVLDYGQTMLTSLKRCLEELDEMETHTSFSEAPQTNLAPIPIPKFSGRIWEWDTFWGAFKHSVDSREMDDLYKMNYLLDALQGEAKETVKQFEEKYGSTQALVDALNLPQLQRDMNELMASLKELNSQNVVDVNSQPASEMERILRQMGETERELKEVRDAMLEVNQSIERERRECKGRSGSTRTIDDLKQRRSRLQAREDRVEREMRDLERRLEREEALRSLSHSRTREHSEEARRSCDSRSTGRDQDARRGQEKRRSSTRSTDHQHRRPNPESIKLRAIPIGRPPNWKIKEKILIATLSSEESKPLYLERATFKRLTVARKARHIM